VRVRGVGQAAYATTGVLKSLDVWQRGYTLLILASAVTDPIQTDKSVAKLAVKRL
jgi:hypothetical protein